MVTNVQSIRRRKKIFFPEENLYLFFYLPRVITVVELLQWNIGAIFKLQSLTDWNSSNSDIIPHYYFFLILSSTPIITSTIIIFFTYIGS